MITTMIMAVFVATIAGFGLGSLWYRPLFAVIVGPGPSLSYAIGLSIAAG